MMTEIGGVGAFIGKVLFCFAFGATMRIVLRSKWYGPGMVAVMTVISAFVSGGSAIQWIQAASCTAASVAGALSGGFFAKLFKIKLSEDAQEKDQDSDAE